MMAAVTALLHLYVPITCALFVAHFCLAQQARTEYWLRLAAISIALPTLAFLLPSLVLLHIAMFLLVPLTARRDSPGDVAAIYLFAMLMLPGFGTYLYLGGTMLWWQDIDQTLGFGALLTLLRYRRRNHRALAAHAPFLCIFATWVLASARGTSFTNLLRELVEAFLVYGLPYLIMIGSVRTREDIRKIMVALAVGGGVVSGILIFEAVEAWPFYRQLYDHYGLATDVNVHLRAGFMRAAGPFMEPISGALVLVFCFFAGWLSADRFKSPMHHRIFVGLLFLGLLPPQSRGAWVGALVGVLLMDLFRKKYGVFGRNVTVLVAGLALLLPLSLADHRVAEMVGLGQEAIGSANYRQQLWDLGLKQVAAHPLTGQPHDDVVDSLSELRTGENIVDFVNTYLYWALLLGIPGALIFTGGLFASLVQAWRLRAHTLGPPAAFLVAGLAAQMVMLAFTLFSGRAAIMVVSVMALTAAFPKRAREQSRRPAARARYPAGAPPAPLIARTDMSPVDRPGPYSIPDR